MRVTCRPYTAVMPKPVTEGLNDLNTHNVTADYIHQKIRSLRIEFSSALRELSKPSGSEGGKRKRPWRFFNSLMFLRDKVQPRGNISNLPPPKASSSDQLSVVHTLFKIVFLALLTCDDYPIGQGLVLLAIWVLLQLTTSHRYTSVSFISLQCATFWQKCLAKLLLRKWINVMMKVVIANEPQLQQIEEHYLIQQQWRLQASPH
jgi:hypothetical protein